MFVKALSQSYMLMLLTKQIHDEISAASIEEMDERGWWKLIYSPFVMAAEIFFCLLIFAVPACAIRFIINNRRDRKRLEEAKVKTAASGTFK